MAGEALQGGILEEDDRSEIEAELLIDLVRELGEGQGIEAEIAHVGAEVLGVVTHPENFTQFLPHFFPQLGKKRLAARGGGARDRRALIGDGTAFDGRAVGSCRRRFDRGRCGRWLRPLHGSEDLVNLRRFPLEDREVGPRKGAPVDGEGGIQHRQARFGGERFHSPGVQQMLLDALVEGHATLAPERPMDA